MLNVGDPIMFEWKLEQEHGNFKEFEKKKFFRQKNNLQNSKKNF